MIAVLKNLGIYDKLVDTDGNYIEGVVIEGEEFLVNKIHEMNKANHGIYNGFDVLYYQPYAVFRLLLAFRKYIVPTYRSRFYGLFNKRGQDELRVDYEANEIKTGYYTAMYNFLQDNWKNILSFKLDEAMLNYNELSDYEKVGVKRSLADAAVIIATGILVMAMLPDDDEEIPNWQWFIINNLIRVNGDMLAFAPLLGTHDQLRTLNNPFIAYRTVRNFISLGTQLLDPIPDEQGNIGMFEEYQKNTRKNDKGDSKLFYKFNKINPIYNIIEATEGEDQYTDYSSISKAN